MTAIDENLLRAGFAGYRDLEPGDAEVARVVLRAASRRRGDPPHRPVLHSTRPALAGAATIALLLGGAYAVPPTRAAIDDLTGSIASSFGAYQHGEDAQAPGRPLGHDEAAPFYERAFAHHSPRVIAEAGGYKLFAYISPGGSLSFDLGETGVGMGFPSASEVSAGAIYVLGPGAMQHADAAGHVPLFGLAAESVTSVELEYESGPPLRLDDVKDGWVLLADPARSPQAIVARDASGEVLERRSVAYITWSQYTR
jgi:hypothetical protein